MHELSLLQNIIRTAQRELKEHGLARVEEIALEVGELSSVVPEYLARCFPVACAGTPLAEAKLTIERVPALCRCRACSFEYPFRETDGVCPACKSAGGEIVSGTDFVVKHIVAR